MAITSRAERKRRRCDVLERLSLGWGVGAITDYLVKDYKITRRSANLDIQWASNQLIKNLDDIETVQMCAWVLSSIQRVAQKSEDAQQYGVTLGCYKLLYEMTLKSKMEGHQSDKHTWKNYRSV